MSNTHYTPLRPAHRHLRHPRHKAAHAAAEDAAEILAAFPLRHANRQRSTRPPTNWDDKPVGAVMLRRKYGHA